MHRFQKHTLVAMAALIVVLAACEPEFEKGPHGLQTRDLRSGDRSAPPATAGDLVVLHYTGTTPVGGEQIEFFNSYESKRPVVLPLISGRIIKGFELGLVGMHPGGKRELIVPPELAYGSAGAGGVIPPDATLHFSMELLEVRPHPEPFADGQRQRHPRGFEYVIQEPGIGERPHTKDFVQVHISRFNAAGELLDSSRFYGEPYELHLGQKEVPDAWNILLARLKPGGTASLFVPYRLLNAKEREGIQKGDSVRYDLEFVGVVADHYSREHEVRAPTGAHAH